MFFEIVVPPNGSYYESILEKSSTDEHYARIIKALNTTLDHFNISENRKIVAESLLRMTLTEQSSLDGEDDRIQALLQMQAYFKNLM